jgi:hypothetical protein
MLAGRKRAIWPVNCRARQSAGACSDVCINRGSPVDQANVPPPLVSVDRHDDHSVARRKFDRRGRDNVAPTHFGEGPELSLGLQLQANFG